MHAPVLVDRVQVLEAQMLDHSDRKLVVAVLDEKLDNVFRLVFDQLVVCDGPGKLWGVAQLDQHY